MKKPPSVKFNTPLPLHSQSLFEKLSQFIIPVNEVNRMSLNYESVTTDNPADKKAILRKWAHDFQNPVSSIQLIAEFLKEQEPDAEKAADLRNILTCCEDLNKLIDDLLAKEASF